MSLKFIRSSHLDLLCTCPRKFQYIVLEELLGNEGSPSLNFGTAWHLIHHLIRQGVPAKVAWEKATETFVNPSKGAKTKEKLLLGIEHYISRYGKTLEPISPAATEQEFTVQLPGISIPIQGHVDMIGWWDANEGRGREKWIVDHKTTSWLAGDWVQKYSTSNQFKCYYKVGKLEHADLAGVLVDIFHVTMGVSTPRGMAGKTREQIDGCHFYRLPLRFTDFAIQEWEQFVASKLRDLNNYITHDFFPMHAPTACGAYGSNCVFLNVCSAQDPDIRATMKATYEPDSQQDE